MSAYFVDLRRPRLWLIVALIASTMLSWSALGAVAHGARRLVSDEQARHLGLKRAWFAQVRLDRARNHVERAVLTNNRLSVLTSAGVVHELDALTGQTLWIAAVGNPRHPSLGPAASEEFVALLNGSTLYVLDRADGRPVKIRPVGGAPGAAPALAKNYVFVPLVTGRIEAYPLSKQIFRPWFYQSYGRAMVAPLATPESFVWATDSGHLYVGNSDELGVRFRLETASEIVAPSAYRQPFVFAATVTGEVFALHEITGTQRWKYAAGFTVTRAPAAVDDHVFVTTDEPMLHCIDATRGIAVWEAPEVAQFAAASRQRVYGVDELGALVVLDAATGALLGRIPTDSSTNALVNDQTDRIYLVSGDGVVQCLHELDAKEPVYHKPPPAPPGDPTAGPPTETKEPEAATPRRPGIDEADESESGEADEVPTEEDPFGVDDADPFQ